VGVGHLSPSGTRCNFQRIVEYRGNHIRLDSDLERREYTMKETAIRDYFTREYGFSEPTEGREWIHNGRGVDEKVLASTRHGVELRTIYHPHGFTQYFYLVVVSGEFHQENLAVQHFHSYYEDLKHQLKLRYGNVLRKTSPWTSEKIGVEVSEA